MNKPSIDTLHVPPTAPSSETLAEAHIAAELEDDTRTEQRGLRRRLTSTVWFYTLIVFAAEVTFFAITAGDRFLTTNNLILTAQNVAVLTV